MVRVECESMITFKEKPYKAAEVENILNPTVKTWFFSKFKEFSLPQLYGVMEIHMRKNILVSAPTGATKTLTGFLSILNELVDCAEKGILEKKVYCVYVSPLKALNYDIKFNLIEPLKEIEKLSGKEPGSLGIRIGVRTGDTTTKEKSDMLKNPPHILICTPESLAILLTSQKFVDHLHDVQWLIIDEIHALAENKRGVHLSLSIERLQRLSSAMARIGLSATISPLEEIAKFLVGYQDPKKKKLRNCEIVDVQFIKQLDLKVISPVENLVRVSHEELQNKMYTLIHELVQQHKTTLIFTNTRSATERVVDKLKDRFPKFYTGNNIGAHHGSLSKDHRFDVEQRLREGKIKCVVSSTSLELGIDIGFIDLVLLLGSPKSVARALQRCLPYDSPILCGDGTYRPIGTIVEKRLPLSILSYDQDKGFIKNKIKKWHKNNGRDLLCFKLKCGEILKCTREHPILTDKGWKKAIELRKGDLVTEVRAPINFNSKSPYLFELLPKDKIFVQNKDNFFQKTIDKYRVISKINAKKFAQEFGMPYSRFIDCRRLKGRKKSIRLDYFLKACKICSVPPDKYLRHLENLKTKGKNKSSWSLRITKELMWLAGIIATDGCIVKSIKGVEYYKIKISNKSRILIDKAREIVNKYGIKPYESIRYIDRNNTHYYLEFGSNLLGYLLMALGIPCKRKSYDIRINNNVFSLPEELLHAYLEGIFEGDGNLNIHKDRTRGMLRIFTASPHFADGMHLLFSRLGYNNRITKSKIKPSKLIKKVSNRNLYCIGVYTKEDLRNFFKNIPGYGEKARKGKKVTKYFEPYLSLRKNYAHFINYSEIVSIKVLKNKKEVYNLTLSNEPNNFVVGNVIVHNCGRSGHQLHSTTKGRIIVLDRDDLVECSVLLKSAVEKKLDKIHIPTNCLDVLAQQIAAICIQDKMQVSELFDLITSSYSYHSLNYSDFIQVLEYLSGKYVDLEARHIYAKIWYDEATQMVGRRGKMARVIFMTNVGTIPDQTGVKVKIRERIIGTIDEAFLERLRPGDVFVLGGDTYRFKFSRGMVAQVEVSVGRPPTVPSWASEMLPLSFDLALEIGKFRKLMLEKFCKNLTKKEIMDFINDYLYVDKNAANSIYEYFKEQFDYTNGAIPHNGRIIIENYIEQRAGTTNRYIVFHSLYGRRVNDCLSRAVAFAISRVDHKDVELGIDDNGFYVRSDSKVNILKILKLIKSNDFEKILSNAIDKTEILKRRFRHCAARALMILRNYKGRTQNVGRQQVSSMILMNAVKEINQNFTILKEARREVLEDLMDINNAKLVLQGIEAGKIKVEEITTTVPSPFAFDLVLMGYTDILKMEDRMEFLKRMHDMVLAKIALSYGKSGRKMNDDEIELLQTATKNNKSLAESFSYQDMWKKSEEKKAAEKDDYLENLKIQAWNLEHVPMFVKEELVRIIDGKREEIRKDFLDGIEKYKDEIKKSWPKEIREFLFKVLKEIE